MPKGSEQLMFGGFPLDILDLVEWVEAGFTIEDGNPYDDLPEYRKLTTAFVGGCVAMVDMIDQRLWLTYSRVADPDVQKNDLTDSLISKHEVARLRETVLRYMMDISE